MLNTAESTILVYRCQMPQIRATALRRQRIIDLIEKSSGNPLVVAAPAGSGKTTALVQWCSEPAQRVTSWLSVEPETHESTVFWSYVIHALGRTIPEIGPKTLLQSLSNRMTRPTINLLINRLAKQQKEFALIIDGVDHIKSEVVWQELSDFCASMPSFGRIVLSGRSLPKFPLSRTSIDNRTHQIGFSALAFNRSEIGQLIDSSSPLGRRPSASALYEASSGWPAIAHALIRSWEESGQDPGTALTPHSDSLALDFIREEVLEKVPADTLDFLLVASALPVINRSACERILAPLCKAAVTSAGMHIKRLYRDYCLLERIDGYGYRCNPVAAALLQKKLRLQDSELYLHINESVAEDLARRERYIEAIPYACKAQCWDMAVDLILKTYSQIGMEAGFKKLAKWLNHIPQEYFKSNPELSLAKAMTLIPYGMLDETERLLDQMSQEIESNPEGAADSEDDFALYCGPPIIRAYNTAFAMSSGTNLLAYAAETEKKLGAQSSVAYESSITLMNGIGNMLQGDLPTAQEQLAQEAERLDYEEEGLFVPLLAAFYLSLILYQRGQLADARQLTEKAIERAHLNNGESLEITGMLRVMYAWLLYDINELELCRDQALQGVSVLRDHPTSPLVSMGYEVLSYVLCALDDAEGLAKLKRQYRQQQHQAPTPFMRLSTHMTIVGNRGAEDDAGAQAAGGFLHLWQLRRAAQTAMEAEEWEQADAVLETIADESRSLGLLRYTMEAQAIRSIIHYARHPEGDALSILSEALSLAEAAGSVRVFLDEGDAMRNLLAQAWKQGVSPRTAAKLLNLFPGENPIGPETVLTPRELEILTLLANGHSPKLIAGALYVSTGTVRTHLHHIYEKLGISGQREAILKAQQLGLI